MGDSKGMKNRLFNITELAKKKGSKAENILAIDPELFRKAMVLIGRSVRYDRTVKKAVFITGLSAYTEDPLNLWLKGEFGVGKTYNAVEALKFFPPEDVWYLGRLSPTALIHEHGVLIDEYGEEIKPTDRPDKEASEEEKERWRERLANARVLIDLRGKILVFLEPPHIETYNMLRPILSHDKYEIDFKITEKNKRGRHETIHVVIRDWPACIFCTAESRFIGDLASRGLTVTPDQNVRKYYAANMLAAEKAEYPMDLQPDIDAELLSVYIESLKHRLQSLRAIIPYAYELAKVFPANLPRSMRDFKHILSIIKVHALFHYAQRPILKIGEGDNEKIYVLATRDDFEFALELWDEIRETTETFLPAHILKFYNEVFKEQVKNTGATTVGILTDAWNGKFNDKRSRDTIERWLKQLCAADLVNKEPDPVDKRQYLYRDVHNGGNIRNYPNLANSVNFKPESLKAWRKRLGKISATKHISLYMSILGDKEASVKEIYERYYTQNAMLRIFEGAQNEPEMVKRGSKLSEFSKCGYHADNSGMEKATQTRAENRLKDAVSTMEKHAPPDFEASQTPVSRERSPTQNFGGNDLRREPGSRETGETGGAENAGDQAAGPVHGPGSKDRVQEQRTKLQAARNQTLGSKRPRARKLRNRLPRSPMSSVAGKRSMLKMFQTPWSKLRNCSPHYLLPDWREISSPMKNWRQALRRA